MSDGQIRTGKGRQSPITITTSKPNSTPKKERWQQPTGRRTRNGSYIEGK